MRFRVYPDQTPDEEFATLGAAGYDGSLQDRRFKFLVDQSLTGALDDMLGAYDGSGGGGPTPWLPTTSTGDLWAWWDASDSLDVTGTTINGWADKSGNARSLTPVSMSTDTAKFGGAAVPRLVPGSYFTLGEIFTPRTAFFVWSQDTTITNTSSPFTFVETSTSSLGEFIRTGAGAGYITDEVLTYGDNTAQTKAASNLALPSGIDTTEHLVGFRYENFDIGIFLDGGADIQDIGLGGNAPNWDAGSTLTIGRAPTGVGAHLVEIVLYSTTLSTDDFRRVEGYLSHKWGIEGKLPVDHPYKAAPPEASVYDVGLRVSEGSIVDTGGGTPSVGAGVTVSGVFMDFDEVNTNAHVLVADAAAADLAGQDFTLEWRGTPALVSGSRGIFGQRFTGDSVNNWGLALWQLGSRFAVGVQSAAGVANNTLIQSGGVISGTTSFDVKVTRVGSTITLSVNGVETSATYASDLKAGTEGWNLGKFGNNARFDGTMEYARITVG